MDPKADLDYATDYAGASGSAPDLDGTTNPIRAGAARDTNGAAAGSSGKTAAVSPHYPFLQPPLATGELGRLGNYRVLRLLGHGGMAFVFLAEDLTLRRRVALKIVKPDLDGDMDAWQRFLREARIMASISHEHLVPVFQVGREGRVHYLAMELLKGETLESWSARVGPAQPRDIVRIGREIAKGLATIHGQGLVHRDVKPGNLWLEEPGQRVKILDLGLARSVRDDTSFTLAGTIVGTPAFMSPEQARGDRVDARTDLFSLGAVLYRIAAGHLPFNAPTTMGMLSALAVCAPRPVHEHNPDLPKALARLIMQLLAKDPEQRPASAEAVIEQLQRIDGLRAGAPPIARAVAKAAPRARAKLATASALHLTGANRRWVALGLVIFMALAALAGSAVVLGVGIASLAVLPFDAAGQPKYYLSDMKPSAITNWEPGLPKGPLAFKKGLPPKDFADVRIGGQRFPHGILMHPLPAGDGGVAKLAYRLEGQYATFHTEVSLNDGPRRSESPMTFSVHGDGKLLWQSQEVSTQIDAQKCSVAVKDVQALSIQVHCAGDPRGAHAVWIEPHFVK